MGFVDYFKFHWNIKLRKEQKTSKLPQKNKALLLPDHQKTTTEQQPKPLHHCQEISRDKAQIIVTNSNGQKEQEV